MPEVYSKNTIKKALYLASGGLYGASVLTMNKNSLDTI
jgi:hypothetical protein